MADKFEDCKDCANRRTDICEECEMGEYFEEKDSDLDFDDMMEAA